MFNAHAETIYPALFRKVSIQPYHRERIQTPDDDFLDLDWLTQNSTKVVVISHGLEGNTQRAYIKGMARACYRNGYDVVAWNYRGCSEEMNKALRFYHSGATDDLATVVDHVQARKKYDALYLVGFSLGGNLTLKYLGESRMRPASIVKAATFSVPLNLHTSCEKISEPSNRVYSNRFLRSLRKKVIQKAKQYPSLDIRQLDKMKTLREFDDYFTGPLHGFKNAIDYYEKCSAIRFVSNIKVPSLIINAENDPFLSKDCFPHEMLKDHSYVTFRSPKFGGHVGFSQFNKNGLYWSEQQVIDFFQQ